MDKKEIPTQYAQEIEKTDPTEKMVNEIERLKHEFIAVFENHDSKRINSVPVSSDLDPTVRFIGSHISVFKPFLEDGAESLPNEGIYMVQKCVRTRNIKKMLNEDFFPHWGSYFESLGALMPTEKLNDIIKLAVEYLTGKLDIDLQDILIRINSQDDDLVTAAREFFTEEQFEFDTKQESYYRHKIGMEGVRGRNFNIAIRGKDNGHHDIGNIILLEKNGRPHSAELALGVSTILKEIHELDHVLDVTPVGGIKDINQISPEQERKLQDCIIFSVLLFQEGLRPIGDDNRNRILKKYTQAMSYFRLQLNLSLEELKDLIIHTSPNIASEDISHTAIMITEYLRCYETELPTKKQLGKDDKKILALLK